jgi:pimeloyl-ACP methyl ester carboxylesterase
MGLYRSSKITNMSKQIFNRSIAVDGVDIFCREAGDKANPSLLLLHGFPTSSVMFKNLMTALSDEFYLIAPDYPGFGLSAFPDKNNFKYTFENISACINKFTEAINLSSFTIYLHDFGCPIGLRLCVNHPEKIERIIVVNGNAYEEGIDGIWDELRDYWEHPTEEKKKKQTAYLSEEGTKAQYYSGVPEELKDNISPELWMLDWDLLKRPGNIEMQFELACDYKNNIEMFPVFQNYLRTYKPPALVIWGKHDPYFSVKEADCYKGDIPNAQVHVTNGAHMVLESNFDEVLELIRDFMRS